MKLQKWLDPFRYGVECIFYDELTPPPFGPMRVISLEARVLMAIERPLKKKKKSLVE